MSLVTPLMNLNERPPVKFVSGKGSWLQDSEGRRYLDFIQGWAVNCLGHSPSVLVEAISSQASRLMTPSPAYHSETTLALADRLRACSGFDQVNLVNSGAEANEAAIKLTRKWGAQNKGGAFRIITFENGFHGRTLATMSACGKPAFDALYEPKVPGFDRVPFNDLAAVEAAISKDTVAIMLEPIQGEGGVVAATECFLQGLRALADEHQLLLVFDEVQTGIGRTGELFAYQLFGVTPDVITLGKGLGGGIAIAAMLAKNHCCCFEPGDQGSTFGGNPLSAAAANAVLDIVANPTFLAQAQANGAALRRVLEQVSQRFGLGEVRGQGLLLALNTHGSSTVDAFQLEAACFELGLLVNGLRHNLLRVMPALNFTVEELHLFEQRLIQGIEQLLAEKD
ncbi:aminotransferase class III-fold pyridoxal phosphate-dependent enzyme [Corallincola luteus]|uniref:Aminotransferase class III-fold pyridoxal phosphate-dependent enzyme n=1 Tax=Corallincola luteus TaxID=1775177 RepID=A0ABY2AGI9_9GAMM|nr:acetylornithine transaminase [Corallincola luteus]TCI01652.1 aminotransferase class III-fold pyridoxal phosphate-dependent enzyme [Corallincola luteus]